MFIVHFLFLDVDCLICSKKKREERRARLGMNVTEKDVLSEEKSSDSAEKADNISEDTGDKNGK